MRFFSKSPDLESGSNHSTKLPAASTSPLNTETPLPSPPLPTYSNHHPTFFTTKPQVSHQSEEKRPSSAVATKAPSTGLPSPVSTKHSSDPFTSKKSSVPTASPSADKLKDLLDRFDPKAQNVQSVYPMGEHRSTIRTMFLDNILYATARLHKHNWILQSENVKYRDLCTQDRWDQIHKDLQRYTRAIQDYEFWNTCFIQTMELEPSYLPPQYTTYGRTLAILECATYHASVNPNPDPEMQGLINDLSRSLIQSHATWSLSNAHLRTLRDKFNNENSRRNGFMQRVLAAIFGGCTLIVPMLIMVIDNRKDITLLTTGTFTLIIGLILAWWMVDAHPKDIVGATAAYAAVLVVFVGTSTS